ncbi:hypothetical protein ACFONG_06575 [Uliginosibacterium paludis]|jgi:hypothetical protein|uniref:Uncharacterized protein n=1 Tax=Uliginosibacterium paludis TaxID=1615952 RepID=A0ABV2CLD7_9RHOO
MSRIEHSLHIEKSSEVMSGGVCRVRNYRKEYRAAAGLADGVPIGLLWSCMKDGLRIRRRGAADKEELHAGMLRQFRDQQVGQLSVTGFAVLVLHAWRRAIRKLAVYRTMLMRMMAQMIGRLASFMFAIATRHRPGGLEWQANQEKNEKQATHQAAV